MAATDLLEPVLTNGIRLNNFFNGRILTAEDLRAEQEANRGQHRQLGRALGEGVAHGLEVAAGAQADGAPVLSIQPGLAFNRDGDAVALGRAVELRLVTVEEAAAAEAGLFAVCQATHDPLELTNVGLYVLTAAPASALSDERAPMSELGSEGVAGRCASRWAQEGARFSVAPLPLAPAGEEPTPLALALAALVEDVEEGVELVRRGGSSDTPAVRAALDQGLSRLRNGAAWLCFGVDRLAAMRAAPLPASGGFADPEYGAVDGMRQRRELASCEVPIALFQLSKRGVEWVDAWAVRRPLAPFPTAGTLPLLLDRRRQAEAVAILLQFQDQLRAITQLPITGTALSLAEAAQYFRFLPPAGLLPVLGTGATRGFTHAAFLRGYAWGSPVQVAGAQLEAIVRAALPGPPLDLSQKGAVVVYRARENLPVAGRAPGPPLVAFVNRDTQRPREQDAVALVFQQAWTVYRGLLKRRVFIPLDPGADASAARIAVTTAVQDVLSIALQEATLAGASALPTPDALDAFLALHGVQEELANVLQTGITGVVDTQDRGAFATQLRGYLNTSLPQGGTALRPACVQRDLVAAVKAQEVINQFVGSWSGEGVAMGFVDVSYLSSPDGDTLALGSPADTVFEYRFEVANHTDRTLALDLAPRVTGGGSAADWTGRVAVRATRGGEEIEEVTLAGFGASTVVFVAVGVPPGAQAGAGTVSLTATGRASNLGKTDTAERAIALAAEATAPVTRSIQIVSVIPVPASATTLSQPGEILNYNITLLYTAEEGPAEAEFELRLTGTGA
ncbi:MAG TPA: hypothetical protein VEX86_01990, partial [Longimicrobium sp.]|nr:hypothetical protein [Longimicrobium sp.]